MQKWHMHSKARCLCCHDYLLMIFISHCIVYNYAYYFVCNSEFLACIFVLLQHIASRCCTIISSWTMKSSNFSCCGDNSIKFDLQPKSFNIQLTAKPIGPFTQSRHAELTLYIQSKHAELTSYIQSKHAELTSVGLCKGNGVDWYKSVPHVHCSKTDRSGTWLSCIYYKR
jgi:hypothetical protein